MGFAKNGCGMKMPKTQRSKEKLIKMDEGELRSLENCFLWEEMVRWRRKIKGKKKANSANGGRKVDGRWSKKEKRETRKWGAKISALTHLNSAKDESTQSNWVESVNPKKKNLFQSQSSQISFKIQIFN